MRDAAVVVAVRAPVGRWGTGLARTPARSANRCSHENTVGQANATILELPSSTA